MSKIMLKIGYPRPSKEQLALEHAVVVKSLREASKLLVNKIYCASLPAMPPGCSIQEIFIPKETLEAKMEAVRRQLISALKKARKKPRKKPVSTKIRIRL